MRIIAVIAQTSVIDRILTHFPTLLNATPVAHGGGDMVTRLHSHSQVWFAACRREIGLTSTASAIDEHARHPEPRATSTPRCLAGRG